MKLKTMIMGAATAAFLAIPSLALAAWGQITGDVNLRTGPSTSYQKITTLPAGARVWVGGSTGNGWVQISYRGANGFVSGRYVATGYAEVAPPIGRPGFDDQPMWRGGPRYNHPPAPRYGYYQKPWWDDGRQAWYDGRRWYRNGVWYNSPDGFSFGFNFGG